MNLTQSKKINLNYAAQIVNITKFEPHPKPTVIKMKVAYVNGCKVLVGIDYKPGLYLYFPVGCQINGSFLSKNNLFKHSELNENKEKKGYFEDSGRVKMLKLQDFYSEGLVVGLECLSNWASETNWEAKECIFNTVNNELLCKKYVIKVNYSSKKGGKPVRNIKSNLIDNNQFRLHYETVQLKRTPWVIKKDSFIHISSKWHGTSGISAYILCNEPTPKYKEFLVKYLNMIPGITYEDSPSKIYDILWSSRKVIKNPKYNPGVTSGFYEVDIWELAHNILKDKLTKGLTLYYEIVGFLPTGVPIQKMRGIPFDYGCISPLEKEEFTYKKHFDIRIYRITYTNVEGVVYEFTARQVQKWCNDNELSPVIEYYSGFAKDLYEIPEGVDDINFGEWFLNELTEDKNLYMEEKSPECNNSVPHEGIVIRLEDENVAYKVKCIKFLDGELEDLDKGISNIEDEQSQE